MDLTKLDEPFSASDIEWRIQQAGKASNGIWAKVLAYVTNRAIMKRLDDVCGKAGWRNEYRDIPDGGGVECGISIKVDGEWITKWDAAENTQVEAVKGGRSGAMKRAAVQWGIGRYLYDLTEGFATVSTERQNGFNYAKTKELGVFYWSPPQLPSWALPERFDNQQNENNDSSQSGEIAVDAEKILKDFCEYALQETDRKKLIERYQHDWQLMDGYEELRNECVKAMNIRVNELKKAA
ncbi:Rad52/Rad22 family DNA repair protein [Phytobacter diazotrophicus]|uniref:Rad52/Rad22 family DNA repair protein n=1 Tax=Phytobacter diazotrophicus TaxID=395631 RepID=UPI002FF9F8A4